MPYLSDPICQSPELPGTLDELIQAVRVQGFEGLVAKRRASKYQSGERSGAWAKMRVNQAQDFVSGGYTEGGSTFDALIFGYFEGRRLLYAGRTRSGSRRQCGNHLCAVSALLRSASSHLQTCLRLEVDAGAKA